MNNDSVFFDQDGTEIKVTKLCLPFVEITSTVTKNERTKKKTKNRTFNWNLSQEAFVKSAIIVSVSATAINAVGNGLAHFIYACKKKKK